MSDDRIAPEQTPEEWDANVERLQKFWKFWMPFMRDKDDMERIFDKQKPRSEA